MVEGLMQVPTASRMATRFDLFALPAQLLEALVLLLNHKSNYNIQMLTEQEHLNPVRAKLNAPFLRKKRSSPQFVTAKKQPFCKAAIAVRRQRQQGREEAPPTPSQPTSSLASSLFQQEQQPHHSVDRELVRKKSQLLSLQLKYLQMQDKCSNLIERSSRSAAMDCDTSSCDERTSCADSRKDKLLAIKARLNRMDFSSCSRLLSVGKRS